MNTSPTPIYKKKWFIILCVVFLIGIIGNQFNTRDSSKNTNENNSENKSEDNPVIPESIALTKVNTVSDGFNVECGFLKSTSYVKTEGKLKIEVFNWELSDGVKYSNEYTYDLGLKLAESTFDVNVKDFKKPSNRIATIVEYKVPSVKKPKRTYVTARFTFTPKQDTSIHITSGTFYETL